MVTGASAGPGEGESPPGTRHRDAGSGCGAESDPDCAGAAGFARLRKYQANPGAAASAPIAASAAAIRHPRRLGAAAGAVRSMTPALTSKIQASATTTGKPAPSVTTT